MDIPLWIYLVVAGIIFSAYMAIRSGKKERQEEKQVIEEEGNIYMERIEKEKKAKNNITETGEQRAETGS
ncbi:sporulation YhaL family protein [Bacillaceae bacterium Marseille-Q3522]|nr:sporulation YhaL family protein [Bacillaceae bacterium Marseille-Q3522]